MSPVSRLLLLTALVACFSVRSVLSLECVPVPTERAEAHRKLLEDYTAWVPNVPVSTPVNITILEEKEKEKTANAPFRIALNGTVAANERLRLPEALRPKRTTISYPILVKRVLVMGGMTATSPVQVEVKTDDLRFALKIGADGEIGYFPVNVDNEVCPQNCLCQTALSFSSDQLIVYYP